MAFEHRENSGSLFKNDKKLSDMHPDYKGDGLINGKQVWISAWVKEGKNGKFMSLSFTDKEAVQQQGIAQAKAVFTKAGPDVGDGAGNFDDDIPF